MCTVQTKYGALRGVKENDLYLFHGVPYAQPPIGELRFRRAKRPIAWKGVLDCTASRPMAMQQFDDTDCPGEPYITDFFFDGLPEQSEDCLYAEITSPAIEGKHPVYVWFHGGGLSTGFSYEPEFNPTRYAENGIVVVSIGQRLNVFGFLALKQLADEDGCAGNYGLSDELCALEWVRENIAAFGGDPDNITVGGQSGGTVKAMALTMAAHTLSPDLRPKKLILESGLKWRQKFQSLEKGFENGRRYLESIGLDPNMDAQTLRSLPAKQLMAKGNPLRPDTILSDGKFMRYTSIREAIDQGVFRDMPILVGTNYGEAIPPEAKTNEQLADAWQKMVGEDADTLFTLTEDCKSPQDRARCMATFGICEDLFTNHSRNLMLARMFAEYIREKQLSERPVYVYLFSRYPPMRAEDAGKEMRDRDALWAWHAAELWYAFDSLREGIPPARPWEPCDFALAKAMNGYFSNYIHTGDVNRGPYKGTAIWNSACETGAYMNFADTPISCDAHPSDKVTRKFVQKTFFDC